MQAFISRAQTPDSEFSSLLRAEGWQVYGQSLVTLQALTFDRIPDCDWIFFASKNAVHFFFRQVAILNISLPQVRWAALGSATAEVLSKHVETIHFRGTGAPASTAIAFQGEQTPRSLPKCYSRQPGIPCGVLRFIWVTPFSPFTSKYMIINRLNTPRNETTRYWFLPAQ